MTNLAAAVLTLRPIEPASVPYWTGNLVRDWFLKQVHSYDSALAESLQSGDGLRPYTVSGLMQRSQRPVNRVDTGQLYHLRITTLATPLTDLVLDVLLPGTIGQIVALAGAKLVVESISAEGDQWTGKATDAALLQEETLQPGGLSRSIELTFASPTAFNSQTGMTVPFPLPSLVFGSLMDRWNTFNSIQLHPDTRRFAEECVAASRYQTRTTTVTLDMGQHRGRVTAFKGFCRYFVMRGDRYWLGVIHALAAFACYSGMGIKTTMGMGIVLESSTGEEQTP